MSFYSKCVPQLTHVTDRERERAHDDYVFARKDDYMIF